MNTFTICPACKIDYFTCSNLNKHLTVCKKYDSFILTYNPPKGIKCSNCNISFINKIYLNEHIQKYK